LENNAAIYYKKKHISMQLVESNEIAIQKWKDVFSMLDITTPSTMQDHLYQRTFESAPQTDASFKSVTGNLVEELSEERIEFFNDISLETETEEEEYARV